MKTIVKSVNAFKTPLRKRSNQAEKVPADAAAVVTAAPQPWNHSWPYRKAGPSIKMVAKSVVAFKAPLRKEQKKGVVEANVVPPSHKPAQPWTHSWPYRKAGPSIKIIAKSVAAFKAPIRKGAAVKDKEETSKVKAPVPTQLWSHSWPYRKAGPSIKTIARSVAAFKAPLRRAGRRPLQREPVFLSIGVGYPSFVICRVSYQVILPSTR